MSELRAGDVVLYMDVARDRIMGVGVIVGRGKTYPGGRHKVPVWFPLIHGYERYITYYPDHPLICIGSIDSLGIDVLLLGQELREKGWWTQ